MEEEDAVQVTVELVTPDDSLVITLNLLDDQLDDLTVMDIKELIIMELPIQISTSDLDIRIGGSELADDWTGDDFGLQDGTHFDVACAVSLPLATIGEEHEEESDRRVSEMYTEEQTEDPDNIVADIKSADDFETLSSNAYSDQQPRGSHRASQESGRSNPRGSARGIMRGSMTSGVNTAIDVPLESPSESDGDDQLNAERELNLQLNETGVDVGADSRFVSEPSLNPKNVHSSLDGSLRSLSDFMPEDSMVGRSSMAANVHELQILRMSRKNNQGCDHVGEKMRRRIELKSAFDSHAEEFKGGSKCIELTALQNQLESSSGEILSSCFRHSTINSFAVKEDGRLLLTWDRCLDVLQLNEPQASKDYLSIDSENKPVNWFDRGRSTILMDVSIQNQQYELQVDDETNVEEVAMAFVQKYNLEHRFLRPLIEQIRATSLEACREELRLAQHERDTTLNSLFIAEAMLLNSEKRACDLIDKSLESNSSNSIHGTNANPRMLKMLTEKVSELSTKLLDYQELERVDQKRPNNLANADGNATQDLDEEFTEADLDGDGKISRNEWRKWTLEKQKIMQAANSDREKLIKENKRLRMALNPQAQNNFERLKLKDDAIDELREEISALRVDNRSAEAEWESVYRRIRDEHGEVKASLSQIFADLETIAEGDPDLGTLLSNLDSLQRAHVLLQPDVLMGDGQSRAI
mmetsp:Transcript_9645/g.12581  ORF Transcript_9645/g.12581 Transcript_9645/m.12581 type:complete len:698 (-) Transcript_9645:305-2398(-)|eukprot:CAMPEP_0185754414 /NCGR_PEP_ID=MMETSP1174-20130828/13061_1 /TAXON_ID=35687 /ORGANISM="Dictyocha speculum, Strain CCMP1381" /LENGTH=697 /DNA_ID=CAMNT_0028432607 /DNA_START=15 /DNA_END=2108 /DNA_ORIENTATION=-